MKQWSYLKLWRNKTVYVNYMYIVLLHSFWSFKLKWKEIPETPKIIKSYHIHALQYLPVIFPGAVPGLYSGIDDAPIADLAEVFFRLPPLGVREVSGVGEFVPRPAGELTLPTGEVTLAVGEVTRVCGEEALGVVLRERGVPVRRGVLGLLDLSLPPLTLPFFLNFPPNRSASISSKSWKYCTCHFFLSVETGPTLYLVVLIFLLIRDQVFSTLICLYLKKEIQFTCYMYSTKLTAKLLAIWFTSASDMSDKSSSAVAARLL